MALVRECQGKFACCMDDNTILDSSKNEGVISHSPLVIRCNVCAGFSRSRPADRPAIPSFGGVWSLAILRLDLYKASSPPESGGVAREARRGGSAAATSKSTFSEPPRPLRGHPS